MSTPSWRPMSSTKGLPTSQAAKIRSEHRALMAIRWRDRKAREEDHRLKRLPSNWHDWMGCPGKEGYAGPGCTCDSWDTKRISRRFGAVKIAETPAALKLGTPIDNQQAPFMVLCHGTHT